LAPLPFRPWLRERILADDADVLVVDKPSGLEVHGGDEQLATDVVRRLGAELRNANRDDYLGVHQRLDVGTSGVLLFVRDRSLNAGVARDFEGGAIGKRYVAGVELAPRSPLARTNELTLMHRLARDTRDKGRMRVVQRGGQPCESACRVIARAGKRALVALQPRTGRTHQLRVQLAAIGAPIAGDREYGGAPCLRLLLHAESLSVPSLGRSFASPRPPLFARWLAGDTEALGDRGEVQRKLADAACRRHPLLEYTEALRWVNGAGDELPGVVVDYYAGHVTLALSRDEAIARRAELAELLHELGAASVYLKLRPRADLRRKDHAELAPALPLVGSAAPDPLVVREGALRLEVAPGDGLSSGLFVDQRDNRRRLFEQSHGARVLNLFAYTGSFSVAAALGGAARVTSVDVAGRALARARENFRANGLDPELHAFEQADVFDYLARARGRGERFEWIVLDPPSFSSSGGSGSRVLRVERDYARLAGLALGLLAPGGRLLAVTNHRGTSRAALRTLLLEAAASEKRAVRQAKELRAGLDCPDGPSGPDPSKAVLVTLA
jgi:23S rRNA (cytosine1962-C5)-methyltransferase